MEKESCCASVMTSGFSELRFGSMWEKKKDAAKRPSACRISARDRAIADLPTPAGPWSQVMSTRLLVSFAQFDNRFRKEIREPG